MRPSATDAAAPPTTTPRAAPAADTGADRSEVVAILAPTGKDGALAANVLERGGIAAISCADAAELCALIRRGVGVVMVAEEALSAGVRARLLAELAAQPSWSDVPLVVLTAEGELSRNLASGVEEIAREANATLLERPMRVATLVTALRSAIRARHRQYDVRDHLRERERLVEAEREARGRAVRMQELAAALSVASELGDVVDVSVRQVSAMFQAAGAVVAWVTDGDTLALLGADGMPPVLGEEWRRFALDSTTPLADVARSGEPIFLESLDDWRERYPALADLAARTGHQANIVVPLVVEGRSVGALGIAFGAPKRFTDDECALADAAGRQCALALARARLFETERLARAEAERANRAKSEFLAMMSHELRTPLNAIQGYTELLELGLRGPVTAEQRMDLERIRKSQRHLLGLINGVLTFARIESGAVRYDIADVPVDELLATCEALVAPQARASGIALAYRGADPALCARADAEKLRQVVLNLLSNAVKFTPAGGRVDLSCDAEAETVVILVSDSGAGIPVDRLESIFEPFVQVDSRLTRTSEGVGLGLAISRDLARGMGGDLVAESTPGVGSTFRFRVPMAR